MKYLQNFIIIISIIIIILSLITTIHLMNHNYYDVNNDGVVNSKDMLDLRLYLLEN